jgi:hypothetical protein
LLIHAWTAAYWTPRKRHGALTWYDSMVLYMVFLSFHQHVSSMCPPAGAGDAGELVRWVLCCGVCWCT